MLADIRRFCALRFTLNASIFLHLCLKNLVSFEKNLTAFVILFAMKKVENKNDPQYYFK